MDNCITHHILHLQVEDQEENTNLHLLLLVKDQEITNLEVASLKNINLVPHI